MHGTRRSGGCRGHGEVGPCNQCGQEINFERLDALPHARLCITCKEKEEDGKRR